MERRIDRADRHRLPFHRLEHAVEIVALQRQQLVERFPALGLVVGEDHPLHDRDAAFAEEHVLGAAQPDAARAERVRELRLVRQIGVRTDAEAPVLVGPRQQRFEPPVEVRFLLVERAVHDLQNFARLRLHLRDLHFAGQPVERDEVAFLDRLAVDAELFGRLVDLQRARADDRRLAHLASDDGGVRRHAAGGGENALRHEHAVDVVRHRFAAHQNHLLALIHPFDGVVGREDHLAARRAWRRRQPSGGDRNLFPLVGIESWRQQLIERLRIDEQDRVLRRDQLFGDEIGRDDHCGEAGPLAAARLQHEQPLVLDRELEILDVLVVLLEPRGDLAQLLVRLRHHLLELADRLRRADAGDDVLALRVDEELTVELLRAGRRVAREADAGARAIAGVAEHHHLHVHGGADVIGDVVDTAVFDRARVHPRPEHGVARHRELLVRILRKVALRAILDDLLVALHHVAERRLVEVGVELRVARLLHRLELVLERLLWNLEDDVAEHLDEAAVAIEREAAVLRPPLQSLHRIVVEAEIEDGGHHAGHRELRAGADGDEQRVVGRSERGAGGYLELLHVPGDLGIDRSGNLRLLLVVDVADLGRDRESRRHGEPGVGHFGQAGAFAPEQVLHGAVAVGSAVPEEIHVLSGFGIGDSGLAYTLRRCLLRHHRSA